MRHIIGILANVYYMDIISNKLFYKYFIIIIIFN